MLARLMLIGALLGPALAGLRLDRTIPLPEVKGRIDHLAFDPAGNRLFVAALGNGTVEVVDLKPGGARQSLAGLAEPQGVLFVPELNHLYVACGGDGTVRVFDGTSLAPQTTIPAGEDADNLRYDPARHLVYVGYGSGAVGAINVVTGDVVATLRFAAHPESFQLEASGTRLFVNLPGAHSIAVADRETRQSLAEWSPGLAAGNYPMALDEAHHRLYVGCRLPARLLTFDTQTGREVARLDLHGDCDDLFYDAARDRLYASCGEGFIDVFGFTAPDHFGRTESVRTESKARTCLCVGEWLFLAVPRRGAQPAEIRCYRL